MAIKRSKEEKRRNMWKLILLPIKVLGKAATFYTKCMEECSSKVGQGGLVLCPVPQVTTLPRSLSTFGASSKERDDEVKELLKCVSKTRNENQMGPNAEVRRDNSGSNGVGISCTLGVGVLGTIDEEEPCSLDV